MKLHFIAALGAAAFLCVVAPQHSASAQSVYRLTTSQAQALNGSPVPILKLSPVYGLNLSFIQSGEVIRKVWLSDPSRVVLDTDAPLTADGATQGTGGATVIRLRQLASPLDLGLNLPAAARNTNETILTVITTAGTQRKMYQFRVQLGASDSPYMAIAIVPDSAVAARPNLTVTPRAGQEPDTSAAPPGVAPSSPDSNRLSQLWKGLEAAKQQKSLGDSDLDKWNRFFNLTTNDADITAMAASVGLSDSQVEQLYQLGGGSQP